VTDKAEVVQGKDTVQTKKTRIGKGKQDMRDIRSRSRCSPRS
jgi:hypothetical protein